MAVNRSEASKKRGMARGKGSFLHPDSTHALREGGKSSPDLMEAVGHLLSFISAESSGKILEGRTEVFLTAR